MKLLAQTTACAVLLCGVAAAHELRPAYLDLLETSPDTYAVLWKTPMQGDARLGLTPEFSGTMVASDITTEARSSAAIQQWTLSATSLRGQKIKIRGLESTMTDTLVHISFADGKTWTQLLTPRMPEATIPESIVQSAAEPTRAARPLLPALLAWGVMCGAAAVARRSRRPFTIGLVYLLGLGAAYVLIRSIAEFKILT